MNRDTIIEHAANELRETLGPNVRLKPRTRSVTFMQPPLILDDHPLDLHLVRRPPINMESGEAIQAFERVAAILTGNPDDGDTLGKAIGPAARMVRRFPTLESQLVVTCWYLAGAPGIGFEFDDKSCVIHCQTEGARGLHGTALMCHYTEVTLNPCNPRETLTSRTEVKCTDSMFVMAYGLARQQDRSGRLADTVTMLYQAVTPTQWRELMVPPSNLCRRTAGRLERAIFDGRDPLMSLYKALVPKWLSMTEFQRTFGFMSGRSIKPDIERRAMLFNKLAAQPFYPQ